MGGLDPVWMVVGLVLLAGLLMVLAIAPWRRELPMSRRRPDVAPPVSVLERTADRAAGTAERVLGSRSITAQDRLALAGVRAPARDVLVLIAAVTLGAFALGFVLSGPALAVLLALVTPLGSWGLLVAGISRRRSAFGLQLSEILQIVASGLRSGTSLAQSMQVVAAEGEEPAKGEFIRVGNETRMGRPAEDALMDVATRMQSTDFQWVAEAVAINHEVGGNLADVLDAISVTIRERESLRRQVSALSADGRLSAIILMLLPVGVFLFVSFSNPQYFAPLLTTPMGWGLIGVAIVLYIVGGLWMRATIRIKY